MKSKQSNPLISHPVVIGNALINLDLVLYTKRYQLLQSSIQDMSADNLSKLGIGINGNATQLAFIHAIEPEKQVSLLTTLNEELQKIGLLDQFFILPDSTIIRPELIASAEYGEVNNGCVVKLYSANVKNPLITSLLNSEGECLSVLNSLAERLKTK